MERLVWYSPTDPSIIVSAPTVLQERTVLLQVQTVPHVVVFLFCFLQIVGNYC